MEAPQGVELTGTNRPRTCPTHPQAITNLSPLRTRKEAPSSRPLCISQRPHPRSVRRRARSLRVTCVGVARCSGGHSGGETPGPIPNPEAKPSSADGTAADRPWESRTPPEHPTTPTPHAPHFFISRHVVIPRHTRWAGLHHGALPTLLSGPSRHHTPTPGCPHPPDASGARDLGAVVRGLEGVPAGRARRAPRRARAGGGEHRRCGRRPTPTCRRRSR